MEDSPNHNKPSKMAKVNPDAAENVLIQKKLKIRIKPDIYMNNEPQYYLGPLVI